MNSPETATTTKPSLAHDWLSALRYWLRGRNGVIALIGLAFVIDAAFNWSWLVAVGIAPLLLTALPCVAMCALGLCMNRMVGSSCSTETNPVVATKPDARVAPSLEAGEPGPLLADKSARPDEPIADSAISPEERS